MPFSAKPASQPDAQDWAARAPVGAGKVDEASPPATPAARQAARARQRGRRPWLAHDPKEPASKAFNLRLNDYELELLRAVAHSEYCSQQALAKRILVRALEQAANELP
jgi:hypothetical protein